MTQPATAEVGFETVNGQKFTPGVQGFSNAVIKESIDPSAVSPNAIRWLFNPFAYINIADRPFSGHMYLIAGSFIPITNQVTREPISGISSSPGKAFDWQYGSAPQEQGVATPGTPQAQYRRVIRTAHAISSELEDAYADKGVRILPSMTKFEEESAVNALHAALIAPGLKFTPDPYQPGFPVPNLVVLERYLMNEASRAAQQFGDGLALSPAAVVADVLVAVRTAIQTCRNTTRDAKRNVANRTVGYQHTFDAWHTRCFLALGEEVPSDLPFQAQAGTPINAGQDAELARLRAENEKLKADAAEKEIANLKAENERLKLANELGPSAGSRLELATDTGAATDAVIMERCDFIKSDDTQCKATRGIIDGRCTSHPRGAENTSKENTDASNEGKGVVESGQETS